MGKTIMVDSSKLVAAASQIEMHAGDYKKTYEQMMTEVDNMAKNWSGKENVSFTAQIKGFQDDLLAMYQLLMDYAEFLKNSAKQYNTAQDNIDAAAKKLIK